MTIITHTHSLSFFLSPLPRGLFFVAGESERRTLSRGLVLNRKLIRRDRVIAVYVLANKSGENVRDQNRRGGVCIHRAVWRQSGSRAKPRDNILCFLPNVRSLYSSVASRLTHARHMYNGC